MADSSYAAIELLAAVCGRLTVITRLRLDARPFDPPPPRRPGTMGRPRVSGARQPSLAQRLADPKTRWRRVTVAGWYGWTERQIDLITGMALWYHPGKRVPICWLLVRDVAGEFEPQGFLCTDPDDDPLEVLRWFVQRWSVEVTFAEVRRHLGVESQRQWSDFAIARTAPALLGWFSPVTLGPKNSSTAASCRDVPSGTPSRSPRSATLSPPSATASGPQRLSPPHRTTPRLPKSLMGCWNVSPKQPALQPEWPNSS